MTAQRSSTPRRLSTAWATSNRLEACAGAVRRWPRRETMRSSTASTTVPRRRPSRSPDRPAPEVRAEAAPASLLRVLPDRCGPWPAAFERQELRRHHQGVTDWSIQAEIRRSRRWCSANRWNSRSCAESPVVRGAARAARHADGLARLRCGLHRLANDGVLRRAGEKSMVLRQAPCRRRGRGDQVLVPPAPITACDVAPAKRWPRSSRARTTSGRREGRGSPSRELRSASSRLSPEAQGPRCSPSGEAFDQRLEDGCRRPTWPAGRRVHVEARLNQRSGLSEAAVQASGSPRRQADLWKRAPRPAPGLARDQRRARACRAHAPRSRCSPGPWRRLADEGEDAGARADAPLAGALVRCAPPKNLGQSAASSHSTPFGVDCEHGAPKKTTAGTQSSRAGSSRRRLEPPSGLRSSLRLLSGHFERDAEG